MNSDNKPHKSADPLGLEISVVLGFAIASALVFASAWLASCPAP